MVRRKGSRLAKRGGARRKKKKEHPIWEALAEALAQYVIDVAADAAKEWIRRNPEFKRRAGAVEAGAVVVDVLADVLRAWMKEQAK
jgi:hypothetical protein